VSTIRRSPMSRRSGSVGLTGVAEALGREAQFDPYASENPGEFFAVMSEAFFETPLVLRAEYPALYAQLTAFYRQNPAARSAAGASGTASDCAYN